MTARGQLGVVAIVLAAIGVAAFTVMRALGADLSPLGVGTPAPQFSAYTIDPRPARRTLGDYKGQVVLVNVWATWCIPCRTEIPSLERLYRIYGPKGLRIAAVSIDDAGTDSTIRAYQRESGMTFDVLHDPTGSIKDIYQTTGVPETLVVGRDGVIRKKVAGAIDWDSDGNRRLIDRLLAE